MSPLSWHGSAPNVDSTPLNDLPMLHPAFQKQKQRGSQTRKNMALPDVGPKSGESAHPTRGFVLLVFCVKSLQADLLRGGWLSPLFLRVIPCCPD